MGMFDSILNMAKEQTSFMMPQSQDPVHKGMFGLKGTPRDILGILGDALLVGSGNKAMYMPGRQNEKIGDAMLGFGQDPMKAIAGVSAIDPVTGQKYYNDMVDNEAAKAAADRNDAQFNQRMAFDKDKEAADNRAKHLPSLAGFISSSNPQTYSKVRERAITAAKNLGITLPYDLPPTWDADTVAMYKDFAVNPQAQANLAATNNYRTAMIGQGDRRLDITESKENTPKPVGSYTREDGKKVVMYSDGTERESEGKVMPTGRTRRRGGASATAPQTYAETKTYQGKTYGLLPGKDRKQQSSWVVIN